MTFDPGPTVVGAIQYPAGVNLPVASAAQYLLATIVQTYADVGIALPSRHVITVSTVAVEEPLIAVMYGGATVGPPGNELRGPSQDDAPRSLLFNVELWRGAPGLGSNGLPPAADDVTAAAEMAMQDSWLLLDAAYRSDQIGVGIVARTAVLAQQGDMIGISLMLEMVTP